MLRQRILTALVLIPLVVAAIWWLPTSAVAVLVGGLMLVSVWEWSQFVPLTGGRRWAFLALTAALMILLHPMVAGHGLGLPVLLLGGLWWLVAAAWLRLYPGGFAAGHPAPAVRALLGLLVTVPCYLALWKLHALESGRWLIFLLLVLVWATDTGGYFAGKSLGRHKLAPSISPNKTWEGLYGGVALALALALAAAYTVLPVRPLAGFLGLALLVSLVSVVGDLTVSMFKRQCGIKDTGVLFPGHGGALDRLDSLFSAAPVLFLGYGLLVNAL